jgi:shikimate kinase
MNPAPNLVLVGPMGAGKTSIGKRLAKRMALEFVDADHRLEQIVGAAVPVIFELEGEAGFRLREEHLLAELLQGRDLVIATGGGAVLSPGTRELLRKRSYVVYLKVGVPQQLSRLARDHSRPLLAGADRTKKLETLADVRNPLYEAVADMVFDSNGLSVGSATNRVCTQVQAQWRREEIA